MLILGPMAHRFRNFLLHQKGPRKISQPTKSTDHGLMAHPAFALQNILKLAIELFLRIEKLLLSATIESDGKLFYMIISPWYNILEWKLQHQLSFPFYSNVPKCFRFNLFTTDELSTPQYFASYFIRCILADSPQFPFQLI